MLNYSMLAAKITENFNLYFTSLSYTPVNFSLLNKEENFWKKGSQEKWEANMCKSAYNATNNFNFENEF